MPLAYQTFYYAGVGPYHEYDKYENQIFIDMYPDLDDTMHFEEYGFLMSLKGYASLSIWLGGYLTNSAFYYVSFNGEADVLSFVPWIQIFLFTRPTD